MKSARLLGVVLAAAALSTCSEPVGKSDPGPDKAVTELTTDAQVSNPIPLGAAGAVSASMLQAEEASDKELVYVSMPVGAVPGGVKANVRRLGDEVAVTTAMWDGGFDPVAVLAGVTDSIAIVVTKIDGTTAHSTTPVKRKRPPSVVRTWPPRSKKDTPVNASMVVVFTEPLDERTVSPTTVKLYRGQQEVAGEVRLLEGDGTTIAFTPDANLAPASEYRLVVSGSVADLEGEPMGADVVLGFSTGSGTLGPPTRIHLSPDSIVVLVGSTYQFSAKVFDADGNLLVRPVTWRASEPDLMSISATGLLTAHATAFVDRVNWGVGRVDARVGTLVSGPAFVAVVPRPASIEILPPAATLDVGDTLALRVVTRGGGFNDQIQPPLTVSNSNPAATSVDIPPLAAIQVLQFRTLRAVAPGASRITIKAGGMSAVTDITVLQQRAVDTVRVAPATAEMAVGETLQLTAWLRDAKGSPILQSRPVSWSSSSTSVLTVNGSGKVTAVANGTATITATSEGKTDSTPITVTGQPQGPTFVEIMSNQAKTCAVTPALDTYCWGSDFADAGGPPKELRKPTLLPGGLSLVAMSPTTAAGYSCGRTETDDAFCWSYFTSPPYRIAPTLRFSALSTALFGHGCGVATDGRAYCWGNNAYGQLGDGTTVSRAGIPTAVLGGHAFKSVTVDRHHSCGLTVTGDAYCWGANMDPTSGGPDRARGLLGTGDTTSEIIAAPSRVAGGLTFVQLSAGPLHTCGITTDGKAYCWGRNIAGELGDGAQTNRSQPTAVETPVRFTAISARSYANTCAIATDGTAYCWGDNTSGALGVDQAEDCRPVSGDCSRKPIAVQGNLRFARISLGAGFACGIAVTGQVYCWGDNSGGRLGDGTNTNRFAPTPVSRP